MSMNNIKVFEYYTIHCPLVPVGLNGSFYFDNLFQNLAKATYVSPFGVSFSLSHSLKSDCILTNSFTLEKILLLISSNSCCQKGTELFKMFYVFFAYLF